MKKILKFLIVFMLILFMGCSPKDSEPTPSQDTEVGEDMRDTAESDAGKPIASDEDNGGDVYVEPVSDYEMNIIRRNVIDEQLEPVLNGKYRDWISVDEIVTAINSRFGGPLLNTETTEEIAHQAVVILPDIYFGTWEDLDDKHYPPDGWDRIFEIPTDGKLIFRISD